MLRRMAPFMIEAGKTKSKSLNRVADDLHIMLTIRYHYETHGCFGQVETSKMNVGEFHDYVEDSHAFSQREWELPPTLEVR